jgi:hypothetical protein
MIYKNWRIYEISKKLKFLGGKNLKAKNQILAAYPKILI